jgi:hypothetical protein
VVIPPHTPRPGILRNGGPAWTGIPARLAPELWPGISRNTHTSQLAVERKLQFSRCCSPIAGILWRKTKYISPVPPVLVTRDRNNAERHSDPENGINMVKSNGVSDPRRSCTLSFAGSRGILARRATLAYSTA